MAPTPQEPAPQDQSWGDRVVISGISGLYPDSHNVGEFADILYNKVDPIRTDHKRWAYNHPEASMHIGVAPDLTLFDSQFFKIHRRMGLLMDPMSRKLLEESYRAIYDAGLSPEHLSHLKVGVYIGSSLSESENSFFYDPSTIPGLGIVGRSKTMFANRISYWLNAKGPSHVIDQACSSSTAAIEEAYKAIKNGYCEAAIAGAASLCLHPQSLIHYGRLSKLSMDGKTKSYDQNADGCTKSEAISVVFLQKAKDALRIYGEIVHIKNEYIGLKEGAIGPKFGFDRDPVAVAHFIRKVYDEAGIPPSVVEYVEGFGSADPEADKSELEALAMVFKRDPSDPLFLGTVMSNIGYTEAASGITAITKVLLAYHKGELAGNLHFESPRQDIPALREGRLKVLSGNRKFRRSFTAVNGLSCTGVNSHTLLHGYYKHKDRNRYKSSIPRLVTLSSRMEEAVENMVNQLKTSPIDPEQLALLHNIHSKSISGHLGRGYVILDTNAENETISLSEKVDYFDDVKRPLVFVYSGMGSQWAGMGAQLMKIPIFSAAIERCNRILKPKGLDIVHIITSPDKNIFDNILHSFVGIAAVQIGLTDILRAVGLEPDFIIGHSVGELGCAYADGCFTAEEMILSAYSRGLVSMQTPFIKGSMAAVGMGYEKIKDMCPPEIEVACHNGPDSCTISGPQDVMRTFVEQLTARSIFAKEVPCSNIPYHSRYIAKAGPLLRKYLSDVIHTPKPRSKRWLSTSVPVDRWDEPVAKFCSADYHTNNLLNPVLFEETSHLLPSNGVMVEIAPHGLLQAILRRSKSSCSHIAMTRRGHPDNALHVLEAIGKLFIAGYVPQVSVLYPQVEFPVSTGTPFLSNLVHWMHSERWYLFLYQSAAKNKTATCKFPVSIHDDDHSFLKGNVIRGKTSYPYAAALVAVWDTLAMSTGHKKKQVSVQYRDVHLYALPILHDRKCLRIHVNLHRGTGMFEVLNEDSTVATGYVVGKTVPVKKYIIQQKPDYKGIMLKSDEIYQLLEKRGYSYSGEFRSISSMSKSYDVARIQWKNNWTTFIDSLLQLYTLNHEYSGVSEPRLIRSLTINVKDHLRNIVHVDDMSTIESNFVREHDLLCSDGVMLEEVIFRDLSPVIKEIPQHHICLTQGEEPTNLIQDDNRECQINLTLQCFSPGDLDSFAWIERPALKGAGVPVTVHYCSLNHRDAMQAMGVSKYEGDDVRAYAMEFSGVTDSGERVMGLIPKGAASSRVLAIPELLWPVPDHWTLEDATTVPLAYSQALYCLCLKRSVSDVTNLLVHCGAGGLGQAVISVALANGIRVFTTVSSQKKKHFLLKLFPKLNEQDIGNSRDHSFADLILSRTRGEGCGVCFSCLEGPLKDSTLRISGHDGLTFDFSQISNAENYSFGMFNMTKARSYAVMDASSFFLDVHIMKEIQQHLADGIARGHVVPLTRIVFPPNEVSRALRLLVEGKHRGRVVLRMNDFNIKRHPCNSRVTRNESEERKVTKCFRDPKSSLLHQIASKAGMKIPQDVDESSTLESLGLNNENMKAVYNFLRDTYRLSYSEIKLKSLTLKRIKNLESMVSESHYREVKGLGNFFSNVESDELQATIDMMFLPTMADNSSLRGDEFDSTQTYLCIIPGLEGHQQRFTAFCELLKLRAVLLQPGLDRLQETISETAQRYAEILHKKLELKSNFYLMGYESGVLTALEIAAILERKGLTGTIYCVGATPEGFKDYLEKELEVFQTDEDLQIAIAQHICILMGGHVNELPDIRKYRTWDEKVQICVRALLDRVPHSVQYAEALIKSAYARILRVREYKPKVFRLRSQIVFIRALEQQGDLQMYSDKPAIVYDLETPLIHMTADLRCSNLVNRHLDVKLKEDFNSMNICDSYIVNSDMYMRMN